MSVIDKYFPLRRTINFLKAAGHGIVANTPIGQLQRVVSKKRFSVCINLNVGRGEYTVYTSDLSPESVDFNREEYAASRALKLGASG